MSHTPPAPMMMNLSALLERNVESVDGGASGGGGGGGGATTSGTDVCEKDTCAASIRSPRALERTAAR